MYRLCNNITSTDSADSCVSSGVTQAAAEPTWTRCCQGGQPHLRLRPSEPRQWEQVSEIRRMRAIRPPSRTPRPGLVEFTMAGLLTCGSWLRHPSQPYGQWVLGVAIRLQLRGQSRIQRLLATPHRVPFFILSAFCPEEPSKTGRRTLTELSIAPNQKVRLRVGPKAAKFKSVSFNGHGHCS